VFITHYPKGDDEVLVGRRCALKLSRALRVRDPQKMMISHIQDEFKSCELVYSGLQITKNHCLLSFASDRETCLWRVLAYLRQDLFRQQFLCLLMSQWHLQG